MENSYTTCCNSANRLIEISYEDLSRLIRDSERFAIAKDTFGHYHGNYNLENALKPILGNTLEEGSDE